MNEVAAAVRPCMEARSVRFASPSPRPSTCGQVRRRHPFGVARTVSTFALAIATIAMVPVAAQDIPPQGAETRPARITLIRGKESYVQDLNLGPEGTALWKQIQAQIRDPELRDFSKVVQRFNLHTSLPLDDVDPRRAGVQVRQDIRGPGHPPLIRAGSYGVFVATDEARTRFVSLRLELDIAEVCLTKPEIQRVYGKGVDTAPGLGAGLHLPDQTGRSHGTGLLPPLKGAFDFAASGCTKQFSMIQVLTN